MARLTFCPGARKRHEAAGVPELLALGIARPSQRPAAIGAQGHFDVRVAETGNAVAIGIDRWHLHRVLLAGNRLGWKGAHDATGIEVWAVVVARQAAGRG